MEELNYLDIDWHNNYAEANRVCSGRAISPLSSQ